MKKEQNDHKEIGRRMELFYLSSENPGMVLWFPKGVVVYDLIIEDLRKRLQKAGYQEIKTPHLLNIDLWRQSGHWENYKDKMFLAGNDAQIAQKKPRWAVKPMNCPGAILLYNAKMHSYKDLPVRLAEVGTVYRYEQAGEVNGLFRARGFEIDDAHIFCQREQVKDEIVAIIRLIEEVYQRYGFFGFSVELSTRPEKSIGTEKQWREAEKMLVSALKARGLNYKENKGEGAFYGPKIDFHIKDSLGRNWQLSTIQLDFVTALRFGSFYVTKDNKKQTPVLIHRAIFGSLGRFLAILLEHTSGALPFWLSPVQAMILPVSERHFQYAQKVCQKLKQRGLRVEIDQKDGTLERKIRNAQTQKIPWLLVVGDKEEKNQTVALRIRDKKEIKQVKIEELEKERDKEEKGKNYS